MRDPTFRAVAGFCLLAMASLAYGPSSGATLVLKDGAVIHGEIKTLQDDIYTVETGSLGTLRIPKQNVRTIDHGDEPVVRSPAREPASEQTDLEAMQAGMIQNPGLLSMILSLQNDPEVQAVLADPEVMRAITAGDYAALVNHPKMIALTNNPKVREIIEAAR